MQHSEMPVGDTSASNALGEFGQFGHEEQQPLSLVDALGRIAFALERGGDSVGSGGDFSNRATAAAMAAIAASAAAAAGGGAADCGGGVNGMLGSLRSASGSRGGSDDKPWQQQQAGVTKSLSLMTQRLADLEVRVGQKSAQQGYVAGGGVERHELQALHGWANRLDHEVGELRAQVARRLDMAARETAACRRDAQEARAEASALRIEVADLAAKFEQP